MYGKRIFRHYIENWILLISEAKLGWGKRKSSFVLYQSSVGVGSVFNAPIRNPDFKLGSETDL